MKMLEDSENSQENYTEKEREKEKELKEKRDTLINKIFRRKLLLLSRNRLEETQSSMNAKIHNYSEGSIKTKKIISQNKKENKRFIRDYKIASNRTEENYSAELFPELIKEYQKKGYKIPKLDFNHNLFSMNPLLGQKKTAFDFYQLKAKKENVIDKETDKNLNYLKKLNKIMLHQAQNKDKGLSIQNIPIFVSPTKPKTRRQLILENRKLKLECEEVSRLMTEVSEKKSKKVRRYAKEKTMLPLTTREVQKTLDRNNSEINLMEKQTKAPSSKNIKRVVNPNAFLSKNSHSVQYGNQHQDTQTTSTTYSTTKRTSQFSNNHTHRNGHRYHTTDFTNQSSRVSEQDFLETFGSLNQYGIDNKTLGGFVGKYNEKYRDRSKEVFERILKADWEPKQFLRLADQVNRTVTKYDVSENFKKKNLVLSKFNIMKANLRKEKVLDEKLKILKKEIIKSCSKLK